jgi:hypothetical protein
MLLLWLLFHGDVSDRSVSALVLHRNASLCYIIIILLTDLYPNWDAERIPDHDFVTISIGKHLTINS